VVRSLRKYIIDVTGAQDARKRSILSGGALRHPCGNELAGFASILSFCTRAATSALDAAIIDGRLKLSLT
jgi:hypothetical protein